MDARRFDNLILSLATSSRRRLLMGLAGGLLAALPVWPGEDLEARKRKRRRKKRKRPLQFNEFGCVDVGQACRGKDAKCCSGICQGKKPKKGKRDRSRCVGHDETTCLPGQQLTLCGGAANVTCTTSAGLSGACMTTTGKAAYCFRTGVCVPCTRDTDCQPVCGPQAACIPCEAFCAATGGTMCAGIDTCTS